MLQGNLINNKSKTFFRSSLVMSGVAICFPTNDLQFEITSIDLKWLGYYIDHALKNVIVKEDGQVNDLRSHSLDGHLTPTFDLSPQFIFSCPAYLQSLYVFSTTFMCKDMARGTPFWGFAFDIPLAFRDQRHHNLGTKIQKQTPFISKFYLVLIFLIRSSYSTLYYWHLLQFSLFNSVSPPDS